MTYSCNTINTGDCHCPFVLISIDGWRTGITFSASHFIPGHDKCEQLHGHTFALHVKVRGEKGSSGMVTDFVPLKRSLKRMASQFDHKVLIAEHSKLIRKDSGEIICHSGGRRFSFPEIQTVMIDTEFVTAEELAEHVIRRLLEDVDFPGNVHEVSVGVDEGGGQVAWASRKI